MRMSGESSEIMHLTHLERESAGAYACGAANTEGETRSSSLTLKVQCKYRMTTVYKQVQKAIWGYFFRISKIFGISQKILCGVLK